MNLLTGTVSLIEIGGTYLAVSSADTLMIGQSSEISLSPDDGNSVGSFEYADAKLPAYYLNDQLLPNEESVSLKQNQFCIGLKTSEETDYFVLLCKQFEQIEVSELTTEIQELPGFMCHDKTMVEGVFQHEYKVYLVTSPNTLLHYITNNSTDKKQETTDV